MNLGRLLGGRRLSKDVAAPAISERRNTSKFTPAVVAFVSVAALVAAISVAVIRVPQMAIYVPIITIGLALALQKYVASFFSYFVITFSKIYDLGDRIRIGNIKGDVRRVGLFHTILEEVGEDEKLGGELTGRLLHVPNLIILDQPVLNYSKDYSVQNKTIASDYIFDEVRIPITTDSNVEQACELLESILRSADEVYVNSASQMFKNGYPRFLEEAATTTRVLLHVEPQRIWIKGKFVTPVQGRNALRSKILMQFLKELNAHTDIKLA